MNQSSSPTPSSNKWFWIILVIIILAAGAFAAWYYLMGPGKKTTISTTTPSTNSTLSFTTIAKGQGTGEIQVEKQQIVITDRNQFKQWWDKIYAGGSPKPSLPSIDFSQNMVISVFYGLGGGSGGGNRIEITKINEQSNAIEVQVTETSPGAGCITTADITYPYHFVQLQKSTKEVKFNITPEVKNCS